VICKTMVGFNPGSSLISVKCLTSLKLTCDSTGAWASKSLMSFDQSHEVTYAVQVVDNGGLQVLQVGSILANPADIKIDCDNVKWTIGLDDVADRLTVARTTEFIRNLGILESPFMDEWMNAPHQVQPCAGEYLSTLPVFNQQGDLLVGLAFRE